MRILVDIAHPAHVYIFVHFINEMKHKGYDVIITVRDISSAKSILERFNFRYINLGKKSDTLLGKLFNQLKYTLKLILVSKRNRIDFALGSTINVGHLSKLISVRSFIFDDDDDIVEPLFVKYGHPFADIVFSPIALIGNRISKNALFYKGFHELFYLHPKRFQPDFNQLKELNIAKDEVYFVLRFNAFKAHHDIGVKGLSIDQKLILIEKLSQHGRIFITTEREIEPELTQYKLSLSPEKIHHLLYYATMFIGDSQTMTSEAAVLGTPAIRCNSFVGSISYLKEQEEKYGLTFGFKPEKFKDLLQKIEELLSIPNVKSDWQKRRSKMLADKIDITAFLVWFVENYPESFKIMKENPDYQNRFK